MPSTRGGVCWDEEKPAVVLHGDEEEDDDLEDDDFEDDEEDEDEEGF